MPMVFCRGCAKEIHDTAPTCPSCGAPQGVKVERNIFTLVLAGFGWSVVFWIGLLFVGGVIIGILNPENAEAAGAAFGEKYSLVFLLGSMILSTFLTYNGDLPGTKKQK